MKRSAGKRQTLTAAATVATSSASDSKLLAVGESPLQPQELPLPEDQESSDGLLLHLIRTIALYLFVFLSQTAALAVTDTEFSAFASDAETPNLLDAQTTELERRLHATLLAWVQSEVASNQFDGLLQEQRAFVVIKRFLRQQRAKAAAQCRVLAALLTAYLARLQTPLVLCEPCSMLSSTLEYLLAKESDSGQDEPVPLPMLYPLVNAVDSVSIEQRECLDALTTLLGWLATRDRSQMLFNSFVRKHHLQFIRIEELSTSSRSTSDASAASSPTGDPDESPSHDGELLTTGHSDALGICFVKMLLRHADHIFRRDPEFIEETPALLYSDTEDDDDSSEDGSGARSRRSSHEPNVDIESSVTQKPNKLNAAALKAADSSASNDSAPSLDQQIGGAPELPEAATATVTTASTPLTGKASSRTLRKRKKREEKVVVVAARAERGVRKAAKPPVRGPGLKEKTLDLEDEQWEDEDPLPTVVCVGIAAAAAAGTLAAVLCVIFT